MHPFAQRAGPTPDQLASLTPGSADDPCRTEERDRLLVAAVDALHDSAVIDDVLWSRLADEFDEPQLLDLTMLAGWYHGIRLDRLSVRAVRGRRRSG